jgi:threonine/homoserine/homoserine lactone efflux protein
MVVLMGTIMLFFKAMFIGLCIAAPIGPIGVLCIQRSLSGGFGSGLTVGLGVASADALYALLGAAGVAGFVTAFPSGTVVLQIGGGGFLVYLAWSMMREKQVVETSQMKAPFIRHDFIWTFLLTLSNPMTILSFVGVFSALGSISTRTDGIGYTSLLMVMGVFSGSLLWWVCLSDLTSALRTQISQPLARGIAKLSGLAIAAFGAFQIASGGYRLVVGT